MVDELTEQDEAEGDRVHPVDRQPEDVDADDDAPEVGRQQRDVEEGRRREPQQHRHERVEERQAERVPDQVADHGPGPARVADRVAVEDGRLRAVDQHGPEPELAHHLVQRFLRHQELLRQVRQAVEGGAQQREEIAPHRVLGLAAVAAGDVVAAEQDAHAPDAHQDPHNLRPVIPHPQHDEREDHDDDNGPEVDQLGRQDVGVTVGPHDEVVLQVVEESVFGPCRGYLDVHLQRLQTRGGSLHMSKPSDHSSSSVDERSFTLPAISDHDGCPLLEAVLVDGERGVYQIE